MLTYAKCVCVSPKTVIISNTFNMINVRVVSGDGVTGDGGYGEVTGDKIFTGDITGDKIITDEAFSPVKLI